MSKKRTFLFRQFENSKTYQMILLSLQIQRKKDGLRCPHCSHSHIIGHGIYRDRKRYKCKSCSRTFNDLTHTPLHYSHFPQKFIQFLFCIIRGYSLHMSASCVGIRVITAFYWRHKILRALQQVEVVNQIPQLTLNHILRYWKSSYITFQMKNAVPIPSFNWEEQQDFREWMSHFSWTKTKYLNRYLAWFRSTREITFNPKETDIRDLFLKVSSVFLEQTYKLIHVKGVVSDF